MTRIIQTIVAVTYDKDANYKFLILKKKGSWEGWQFVQGAKEKDEEWETAVRREVKEETGLDCISVVKTDIKAEYWFKWEGELVHKFLTFFLV
ncbi:MAG: NUDIX domain-containing protein, partial [candidate division WOR-3 bacterium]